MRMLVDSKPVMCTRSSERLRREGVFRFEWDEESDHPAATSPAGVELVQLQGYHPVPEEITPMLDALRLDLDLRVGNRPRLVAILNSPYGPVELS